MAEENNNNVDENVAPMQSLFYLEILLRWKNFIIVNTAIVAVLIQSDSEYIATKTTRSFFKRHRCWFVAERFVDWEGAVESYESRKNHGKL